MTALAVTDVYRLTPLQEGILFHHLMEPEAGFYIDQLAVVLDFQTRADPDRIKAAFERLVDRHCVLRTGFIWESQAAAQQVVAASAALEFAWLDWSAATSADLETASQVLIAAQRSLAFDLARPPLLRVAAALLPGGAVQFVVTYHHIILDAWSVALLFAEFRAIWRGEDPGTQPSDFKDFVRTLPGRLHPEAASFWSQTLAGVAGPTPLIAGDPPIELGSTGQGLAMTILSATETEALRAAARGAAVTLASLIHAAWAQVLSLRSGNPDVLIGCTFAGRPADLAGSGQVVGLCINTLPLRVDTTADGVTVGDWLRDVHARLAAVRAYEFTPLSRVREWSGLASGTALFDSVLAFENVPGLDGGEGDGLAPISRDGKYLFRTNYPVNLLVVPGEQLSFRINFDSTRYRQAEIEGCLREFAAIALRLAGNPAAPLSSIGLLGPADAQQMRRHWNGRIDNSLGDEPVHLTVSRHAARDPDAVAITDGQREWTYGWLEQQANSLAAEFEQRGIALEDRIVVHAHRSAHLLVALLAILKVGAAYVPLDPMYPAPRLQRMIETARPVLALCDRDLAETLPETGCPVRLLGEERAAASPSRVVAVPAACAYVIFTSGSSGVPKGIALTHQGLANMLADWNRLFGMNESGRLLQFASISFDASVWELLSAVTAGGTLCIASRYTLYSAEDLLGALAGMRITHALLPPSLLGSLDPGALPDLRCIAAIGERCTAQIAQRWSQRRRFFNAYGPAEGTITDCVYEYASHDEHKGDPPIGGPMANVELYVLDRHGNPLPPGVPGELAIGGVNVARGYLAQPAGTAAKFVPNPLGQPGSRMYLSGDRVLMHEDGALQYLGRADDQVKIRGTRIETGEVEHALRLHPQVLDTLVMACGWPGGTDQRLVAYVIPQDPGTAPAAATLRAFLRERVAEVMIPSAFVPLDVFPLSVNGKIDRKALPEPAWQRDAESAAYRAPGDALERELIALWSRILRVELVGIDDNYFDLGGDSIISIRLVAAAQRAGLALSPRDIFQHQTIAELAAAKRTEVDSVAASVNLASYIGKVAALPMQRQFVTWMGGAAAHYNQAVWLSLEPGLSEVQLDDALRQLVDRHDALRLRTEFGDEECCQFSVQAPGAWDGLVRLAPNEALDAAVAALHQGLDPGAGRVFAALWCPAEAKSGSARVLLAAHHLAIDALSWTILLTDLACALEGPAATSGAPSFAAAAAAIDAARAEGRLDHLAGQWSALLAGAAAAFPAEAVPDRQGAVTETRVQISPAASARLLGALPAAAHGGDAILAALSLASGTGGLIDLEGDGRTMPEVPEAPANAVGWYTAIAPFALMPDAGDASTLGAEIAARRAAWELGSYSFAALNTDGKTPAKAFGGPSRNLLFNWLGELAGRLPADVPFRLGLASSGTERDPQLPRPYPIELNGWIDQGCLVLSWHHPATPAAAALIERVSAALEAVGQTTHADDPAADSGRSRHERLLAALQTGGASA